MDRDLWRQTIIKRVVPGSSPQTATLDVSADLPEGVQALFLAWVLAGSDNGLTANCAVSVIQSTVEMAGWKQTYESTMTRFDPPLPLAVDADVAISGIGDDDIHLVACFVWL